MYAVGKIDGKLCHVFKQHVDLLQEDCDGIYSIWNFSPRIRWRAMTKALSHKPICQAQWFPVVYWTVFAISTLGFVYSFRELFTLCRRGRKRISMWRERKYYVLPPKVLRKCRLVGAFVMLNAWLLLWYAVVSVSPTHMTPWLTINVFVLAFEWLTWIVEFFAGIGRIDVYTLFSFALPSLNLLFVHCVREVFVGAVDRNDVAALQLWKINKWPIQ